MQVHFSLHADTRLLHDWAPAKTVLFSKAYGCETLTIPGLVCRLSVKSMQNLDLSVNSAWVHSMSIWLERTPIGDVPLFGFASTESKLLVIWPSCLLYEDSFWLCRNPYATGIQQVILQGSSPNKALILSLDDNKTVFTLSFDPLKTATIPIPDISVSLEPFPHPCNSPLGHPKDTCHMPSGITSLKHPCHSNYHFGASYS